jgi:hypothetical protein
MRGEAQVVEADQRQVLGHAQPNSLCGAQQLQRYRIAHREDRAGPLGLQQQLLG